MTYEQVVPLLLESVPELRAAHEEHVANYDEVPPHVFFGDVSRFVVASAAAGDSAVVARCLAFLERVLVEGDEQADELVVVSFVDERSAVSASKNSVVPLRAAIYSAPESSPYGWIEFTEPRHDRGDVACTFTFAVTGEEWSVGLDMIEPYGADMLGFFEEMARDAAGWESPKVWESEFAEVRIRATHAGETVMLDVRLRWPPTYEEERHGSISVRPDELGGLAQQMRAFVQMPSGQRFWTNPAE